MRLTRFRLASGMAFHLHLAEHGTISGVLPSLSGKLMSMRSFSVATARAYFCCPVSSLLSRLGRPKVVGKPFRIHVRAGHTSWHSFHWPVLRKVGGGGPKLWAKNERQLQTKDAMRFGKPHVIGSRRKPSAYSTLPGGGGPESSQ